MKLDRILAVGLILYILCELYRCDHEGILLVGGHTKLEHGCALRDLRLNVRCILYIVIGCGCCGLCTSCRGFLCSCRGICGCGCRLCGRCRGCLWCAGRSACCQGCCHRTGHHHGHHSVLSHNVSSSNCINKCKRFYISSAEAAESFFHPYRANAIKKTSVSYKRDKGFKSSAVPLSLSNKTTTLSHLSMLSPLTETSPA